MVGGGVAQACDTFLKKAALASQVYSVSTTVFSIFLVRRKNASRGLL